MILDFIKKKEKYQITKGKKKELEKELAELKEQLADTKNRMEESRNDDSDDDGAMLGIVGEEKQAIEKRIFEVKMVLKNHTIIEENDVCEPGKIELGSEIKVKEGGKIKTFKLVTPIEADPLKNYISDESPVGKKLIKAKVGDKVKVKVRDKTIEYEILEVC